MYQSDHYRKTNPIDFKKAASASGFCLIIAAALFGIMKTANSQITDVNQLNEFDACIFKAAGSPKGFNIVADEVGKDAFFGRTQFRVWGANNQSVMNYDDNVMGSGFYTRDDKGQIIGGQIRGINGEAPLSSKTLAKLLRAVQFCRAQALKAG